MEDDYKNTLRGKIKILFQLEKWQDVNRLCEQYTEKFGKDVEIDMMRFKSERRLNKLAPAEENKLTTKTPEIQKPEDFEPAIISEAKVEEKQPLDGVQNPAVLIMNEIPAADEPQPAEEQLDYEPFPQANELIITDPFAENEPLFNAVQNEPHFAAREPMIVDPLTENEDILSLDYNEPPLSMNTLVLTDPVEEDKPERIQAPRKIAADAEGRIIAYPKAEDEPIFNPAGNEPLLILDESSKAENNEDANETQAEEISIVNEFKGERVDTEIAFDFKSNPVKVFDVEPELDSAAAAKPLATMQIDAEGKKPSAESLDFNPLIDDRPAEVWHMPAAEEAGEKTDEKHHPLREPDTNLLKKLKFPTKFNFNFKYLLVLILPLAAAVALWLALSGKLTSNGDDSVKVNPVQISETQVPAARKPVRKIPPVVQVPQIDEKEKLVTEKTLQAKKLFESGDVLNALAAVLEAKKIKTTEPLSQLEELIKNKIRDDEVRAAEQRQADLKLAQSEEQVFARADAADTIEAWQNFLRLFPQSTFSAKARNKIVVLEKKAAQKVEQELLLRIRQAKKLTLRSDYQSFSQAELNAALQQFGKANTQFEQIEHGGMEVIIDFSSGLMWKLWNKPMEFNKASWWANRIYAGYSDWRLPTVEESQSLQRMDPALYAGLTDFAVWTGDGVSDLPHSMWTLRLPQGKFGPEDIYQVYYVWAVRNAVK